MKTLGISLGVDSIGWSVIDSNHKIEGMGVRVFSPGAQNLGMGEREISNKASKREARLVRKGHFRTRLRKQKLLHFLIDHNMCPLSHSDVVVWENQKIAPIDKSKEWFAMNPYKLRSKAVSEKISLHEFGRVLYHMAQRRGFSSIHSQYNPILSTLKLGNPEKNTVGIKETKRKIKNTTLGEYLHSIQPEENTTYQNKPARIRNRYTERSMYIHEFNVLFDSQKQYHPGLTNAIKNKLGVGLEEENTAKGLLFFQRPLKSKKHLVGNCPFERNKTKAPSSCPEFEMMKIYKWVNSIRYNNLPLSEEQKEQAIQVALKFSRFSFLKVRKALNKTSSSDSFNYHDNDIQIISHTLVTLCKPKFFGKDWFEFTEKEQEDIWHVLYFFNDKKKLIEYAVSHWGFSLSSAKELSEISLKTDYADLSRKAIRNIMFFLKRSISYELAVILGGIKSSLGKNWTRLGEGDIDALVYSVTSLYKENELYGFIPALQAHLKDEFQFSEKQIQGLYGIASQIINYESSKFLPTNAKEDKEIIALKKPLLITAIFQLRKVVNQIIKKYGSVDQIKVTLLPELKASRPQRRIIYSERKRRKENSLNIQQKVIDLGKNPTFLNITKLDLWEESKGFCPYTGTPIAIEDLFTNKVSVVYIRPWDRFINDSNLNRTLCKTYFKKHIEGQTPYEFFSSDIKYNWDDIKKRTAKIFSDSKTHPNSYEKFKHFVLVGKQDANYLTEINDQHHLSLEVQCYLNKICSNVIMSSGFVNNRLRKKWNLDLPDDKQRKTLLDDHRLHAMHALTTACFEIKFLNALAHHNRFEITNNPSLFPMPWAGFDKDVKEALDKIVVSHQFKDTILTSTHYKTRKKGVLYRNKGVAARGSLHRETYYGKRTTQSGEAYHLRKPLETITTLKQINRIVDPVIKKLIFNRIQSLGGFDKGKVPKKAFFSKTKTGKTIPKIFLPNRNGDPVPVLKVRVRNQVGNAVQIKSQGNKYVNPRNNHHVLIYEDLMGNLQQEIVTFWEVVERKRNGKPVIQMPDDGKKIITTLQINDCFILGMDDKAIHWNRLDYKTIKDHVYRVQRLSSCFYEFRRVFDANITKTIYPNYVRILNFGNHKTGWMTYNPIKIKVNAIGEISKHEISSNSSLHIDSSNVVLNV
jgi:CRISPR-associated endonuclease Csn1